MDAKGRKKKAYEMLIIHSVPNISYITIRILIILKWVIRNVIPRCPNTSFICMLRVII